MAFVHRQRTRWHAGASGFLAREYGAPDGDGVVVDVRHLAEFREIHSTGRTLSIGAFADLARLAEPHVTLLGNGPSAPLSFHFRLAALGATATIAGPGATRRAPFAEIVGARRLPPHEIPVAVDLDASDGWTTGFGERRITRRDGAATFDLHVLVALRLTGVHRIRGATVAYAIDGSAAVPIPACAAALDGAVVTKAALSDAARHAAEACRGDGERTSALRRTMVPLVLSALNDAYAHARACGA
jgi:CO/xanthine dehydrogenase FAD-binding subunit